MVEAPAQQPEHGGFLVVGGAHRDVAALAGDRDERVPRAHEPGDAET